MSDTRTRREPLALQDHPQRGFVLGEMHARPFTAMAAPQQVRHIAFMTDADGRARSRRALRAMCAERHLAEPAMGAKYHRIELDGMVLRWEGHSEFTTFTFERPGARQNFTFADVEAIIARLGQPGPLLVMVALDLVTSMDAAALAGLFPPDEVAMARNGDASALFASDFRPDDQGQVRIAVATDRLAPEAAGALVQRLLEIETYRTLALLGLPQAQALAPVISSIEQDLPGLFDQIRQSATLESNRAILDRLTELSAQLEHGASASSFRFGATRAYGDLIWRRLKVLGETPVAGFTDWGGFFARRLEPAIRTCRAVEQRGDDLSRRLNRAAQLLRTRVEIELETQNSNLLTSMDRRAQLQLRLQQTVEGLSVAAISYYVSSLAEHVFEGLKDYGLPVDPVIATALAIPVVLVIVGTFVWRIRSAHHDV
ncbi:MAG: DUF3422 family protein [Hyphomicrobiales bacterium]|nr:DUF3422 family protein [Hyphomicrobiales bacterium]